MGKKGRKVSRPTEASALARIGREAEKLKVSLGTYLRFCRTYGALPPAGQISTRQRMQLYHFAKFDVDPA